jgi:hypothetical protein
MISIERDGRVWRIEWHSPAGFRHERYAREPGDVAAAVVDAVRELTPSADGVDYHDTGKMPGRTSATEQRHMTFEIIDARVWIDEVEITEFIAKGWRPPADWRAAIFPATGTPGTPRPVSLSPRADPDRFSQGGDAQ